jgi:hypothetical protein
MLWKICNSIQSGIQTKVLVYTDLWSFLKVTTNLTDPETLTKSVFRPPLSHSKKHHPQSTQWEMTRRARLDTSPFHPKSYIFLPQNKWTSLWMRHDSPSTNIQSCINNIRFLTRNTLHFKFIGQLLLQSLLNLYQLLSVHSTLPPVHTSYSTWQLTANASHNLWW